MEEIQLDLPLTSHKIVQWRRNKPDELKIEYAI